MPSRICVKCSLFKPLKEFHTPRGGETRCRTCVAAYLREWRSTRTCIMDGSRRCRVCHKRKKMSAFPRELSSSGGRSWRCKVCVSTYQLRWKLDQRKTKPAYKKPKSIGGPYVVKTCGLCLRDFEPGSPLQIRCPPCQQFYRSRVQANLRCSRRTQLTIVRTLVALTNCQYCGCRLTYANGNAPDAATIEHMDPRKGNRLKNLTVACRTCNSFKGGFTFEAFLARCQRIATYVEANAPQRASDTRALNKPLDLRWRAGADRQCRPPQAKNRKAVKSANAKRYRTRNGDLRGASR